MKLPVSWLRELVEFEASPERLREVLTMSGFYVEGIESHGHAYPGVVVARVLEVNRHPNADRLSLCRVDSGAGEIRVVCGAPNVHAGMIAPLATVGATLPGGTVIKKSKIRGEESFGMLCSARELELSEDHEGILDLARYLNGSSENAIGRPLVEVLGAPETVLEVEIPFNRPDGLGVVGLAREVKAALAGRWTDAARTLLERRWSGRDDFDLALEDEEGCPRYIAQAIEGVTIGPSPAWLTRRLESVGQRPINNVVDVTNLVLFELGQPVHAFDLDRLSGPSIRVRRARAGERITTLDGKERVLDPEVLVIADRERPVATAGIMGGVASEVSDSTTRLLLECAWFDPRRVRRGSKFLGLSTEASKRYERGVDPEIGPVATARFVEVLRSISPGLVLGAARERVVARPAKPPLELRSSRCRRLIGLAVEPDDAQRRLESFEFTVSGKDPLRVTVPTWRADVSIEDDLVEEVARSIGYDRIPEAPLLNGGVFATRSDRERLMRSAREAMLSRGISEAWCSTLVSEPEAIAAARLLGAGEDRIVRLQNPMSRESEVLRPNLLPGLLRACAHNLRSGSQAVRLFEIGAGFLWEDSSAHAEKPASSADRARGLPNETSMIAALAAGPRFAHAHSDESIGSKDSSLRPIDFESAKGLWDAWLEEMRVDTPQWRAYSAPGWKPGASAEVASGTSRVGWAGALGLQLLREWEIEIPVQVFLVILDPLLATRTRPSFHLPGRFPPVRRDVAYYVPASVTHRELEAELAAAGGEWLRSIELFDVYSGPGTPQNMKSLAYALQFQHPERTLTDSEIQAIQDRMTATVSQKHGARLRER
jgi:phenylalanyl-tRNA synthetase beta chain